MSVHEKRLENSYKKYPVYIPEKLFREGFDLGKKLGLLSTETFEEVFPKEAITLSEKTAAWYFIDWTNQLKDYLNPHLMQ